MEFDLMTTVFEWAKTVHALNHMATVMSTVSYNRLKIKNKKSVYPHLFASDNGGKSFDIFPSICCFERDRVIVVLHGKFITRLQLNIMQ
jgi:hypothetical protein